MHASTAPGRPFAELASRIRGSLIQPNDPAYAESRAVFNGMIDRRPAALARCSDAADVIQCVRFARDHGIQVAVRCGGHSVAGHGVCDDGLVIDLSAARSVYVDPIGHTARAAGGATWGDFDHETQAFGLATTGGLVRSTGIGGLTLAGGHGFLARRFGLSCDNLVSMDVVTSTGDRLRASAEENTDLFWGLRGGGGNFGIVTSFEYRLHPLTSVFGGLLFFSLDEGRKVLKFYDEFMSTAPDDLGALGVLATLPDGTKAVGMLLCYSGPAEAAERAVAPLRQIATPILEQLGNMPYTAIQSIVENFNPRGMRNYWKASYLSHISEDLIEVMIEQHRNVPTPFTHQVVYSLGGAVSRVGDNDTAVSYRGARHALIMIGMWDDQSADQGVIQYVRQYSAAVQPHSSGGFYPNYEADAASQMKSAFGPEKFARLVALKKKYDPQNFFRLNQNIRPDAA
jgi:FAD/FMN-containing dehydrogenase